jgi:hypothetical protein
MTDETYQAIRAAMRQIHDKIWKLIFMSIPAVREYIQKVIEPQLGGAKLDLDNLVRDDTPYLSQKLDAFASDLVFRTTLTHSNGTVRPIQIALLFEHKSQMPKPLALRLQLQEYLAAIQMRNYDAETDQTVLVISNVFNQFDVNTSIPPFRSHFDIENPTILGFNPEFGVIVANLQDFSQEFMDEFERYGEMRAGLMAMKYAKNKFFLIPHFEKIFVFLERHPEKKALRNQLVTYLIGASDLKRAELEFLLANIFSSSLKQEIMTTGTSFWAVAAQEAAHAARILALEEAELKWKEERAAAEKARLEALNAAEKARELALQLEKRTVIMRSWKKGIVPEVISEIWDVSIQEVNALIKGFEAAKTYIQSHKRPTLKKIEALSQLNAGEAAVLLQLLQK